jgi:hypothetical protein
MSTQLTLEKLREVRSYLSLSDTYCDVGNEAYRVLEAILDGAVASFEKAVDLIELTKQYKAESPR